MYLCSVKEFHFKLYPMGENTYKNEAEMKATVRSLANRESLERMCHMRLGSEPLPQQSIIKEIVEISRSLLFPGFYGDGEVNSYNLEYIIGLECERLKGLLENQIVAGLIFGLDCESSYCLETLQKKAEDIATNLITCLPALRKVLHTDVEAMYDGDPAAVSNEEVIYCYPAIKAITNYRLAHELLKQGVPIIPRMISELAHSETGIDIHPGAEIGDHFAIDHGTGVVIGATAIIGHNVKLYQGVTLGARSFANDEDGNPIKGIPRHPIIGDNVVIYSNASILGRVHIGNNAIIGGNIWVTFDVAEGERLVQAKANNNILRFKSDE
jgi:serine O-acetyltransferase